jgi:general secretion pathway protein D
MIRAQVFFCFALLLGLAGCATQGEQRNLPPATDMPVRVTPNYGTVRIAGVAERYEAAKGQQAKEAGDRARVHTGTGVLVKPIAPTSTTATQPSEEVSLNYEGADLREVVKTILGDILGESYLIDPQVNGTVNIRTTRGIPKNALIATLETLCRMNGAALVKEGGIYKVLPAGNVVRGSVTPQLGGGTIPLPHGYSVILVPLKYIGVMEMIRVLEPFVKDGGSARPDPLRNMLVLSGTEQELRHLVETVDMFDVDWMSGMSAGLFTLKSADVKTVYGEIEKIMGDKTTGPLAGILRIIPIERMNALLIVTPQPFYLEQAKLWVERLDRGGDDTGTQLFVYNVQNGRAEKLAPLLMQAFTGRAPAQAAPTRAAQVAPGMAAGSLYSQPQPVTPQPQPAAAPTPTAAAPATGAAAGTGATVSRNVQIIADKDNNALVIMSTPAEYSLIEAALKKLDVAQKQVLIEVTVAEVALTGDLSFGVQWFFTHGARQAGGLFGGSVGPASNVFSTGAITTTPFNTGQGFNYVWQNSLFPGGIQAALTALDTSSKSKVLSNPHIMAVDNTLAKIQIGDRIPINTQTQLSGVATTTTTTTSYLDTGLTLSVTPRINAGGLVSMDISVEYSIPGAQTDPTLGPPVTSRSAQTTVIVHSGETLLMGGLVKETGTIGSSGLPLLSRIPVLGAAFGTQDIANSRTELLLIITPRVIADDTQMREVTEELRKKMHNFDENMVPGKKKEEPALRTGQSGPNPAAQ